MIHARRIAAVVVVVLSTTTGCVLIGPSDVRQDVVTMTGLELDREVGFRLGRFGMFLVRKGLKMAEEEQVSLRGVRKVEVGVYEVVGAGERSRGRLCRAEFGGWEPVVRVCDPDENVLMFARERDGSIRGLLIVVQDTEEVVIVRARGRMDEAVASVLELAGDGAEAPVTVCTPGEPLATEGCVDPVEARRRVLGVADGLGAG